MNHDPHGWSPVLLDGFVGALVAFAAALLVVLLQVWSENRRARLVSAFAAARVLAEAAFDALSAMTSVVSNYGEPAVRTREQTVIGWNRALALEYPGLFPYIDEKYLRQMSDALADHERLVYRRLLDAQRSPGGQALRGDRAEELREAERKSLLALTDTAKGVGGVLDAFRRHGRRWEKHAFPDR